MKQSTPKKQSKQYSLQELQQMVSCFEDEILPKISSKEEIVERFKQRANQRRLRVNRITSSLLAMTGVMFGLYWYNPCYENLDASTALGEQKQMTLSDGSQITLNTNTRIQVQQRLRSREITLIQGEAAFKVAHGEHTISRLFERSFTVTAGEVFIRDIGTIFNVNKRSETDVEVTVIEGKVEVSRLHSNLPAISLEASQAVTYSTDGFTPVTLVDSYAASAWQSGKIVFNKTSLKDAIGSFQRYSDFKVEFGNDLIAAKTIDGQFQAQNYQKFIQTLPYLANVQVKKTNDQHWRIDPK
ncbi:FecR family protein [Acinetobacter baumannii]|uniref:FecR family protein n=1 Tax=Acinetobacter baumannii TaxID=470 RepID=UPI003FA4BFCC